MQWDGWKTHASRCMHVTWVASWAKYFVHIFAAAVVVGLTCSKRAKKFAHSLVEYNFHHEINGHKIRSKFQNEYDTHRDRSTDDTRNGGGGGDSNGVSGGNISNCKRNNNEKKTKERNGNASYTCIWFCWRNAETFNEQKQIFWINYSLKIYGTHAILYTYTHPHIYSDPIKRNSEHTYFLCFMFRNAVFFFSLFRLCWGCLIRTNAHTISHSHFVFSFVLSFYLLQSFLLFQR